MIKKKKKDNNTAGLIYFFKQIVSFLIYIFFRREFQQVRFWLSEHVGKYPYFSRDIGSTIVTIVF